MGGFLRGGEEVGAGFVEGGHFCCGGGWLWILGDGEVGTGGGLREVDGEERSW